MIVAKTRSEFETARANIDGQLALVPTMGALHDGHLSLCELAKKAADQTAASIFVNPTQFAAGEDLDSYPQTLEADLNALKNIDVDLVYVPTITEMYPNGTDSDIKTGASALGLETDFRPHFFDGVVNIVHRLFDHMKPDIAIFGEKDYQQLMVIREMVKAANMPITITGAPTIRDEMGLALSSRNAYLSDDEIGIARMLNQILYNFAHQISQGHNPAQASKDARDMLIESGFDQVDYMAYKPEWNRALAAVWIGQTRLIDNCSIPSSIPA